MNVFRRVVVVLVTLLVAALIQPLNAAGAQALCEPVPRLVVGADRPIILVHGYNGEPLADTAAQLEAALGSGWQTVLFDYSDHAGEWVAAEEISGCLAS